MGYSGYKLDWGGRVAEPQEQGTGEGRTGSCVGTLEPENQEREYELAAKQPLEFRPEGCVGSYGQRRQTNEGTQEIV